MRRYCVDSATQAFIHALAGCVPRSLQHALCGPRNSRSAHFAAHALDVLATHESPNLKQLIHSGRVKNVYRHFLRFLTLMFSHKLKINPSIYFSFAISGTALTHWGLVTHTHIYMPIIYAILCRDMCVVSLAPCHYSNQCWHTLIWTSFSEVHIKIFTSLIIQEMRLKISCAKRRPFWHRISVLEYENHRCYVSIQF